MLVDITVADLNESLCREFYNRTTIEGRKRGIDFGLALATEVSSDTFWIKFSKGDEGYVITIPVPFEEDGVQLIRQNMVTRAVNSYYDVKKEAAFGYLEAVRKVLIDDPSGIIPDYMIKSGINITRMINSFSYGTAAATAHNVQRCINEVVNNLPLHETSMKSYVMNNRITLIDREFDELTSPDTRLEYQVEKNGKYFDKGWTSVGLSDGTLADKNYMLTHGLRRYTPFGTRFHNPARNLYSATGMCGDEIARIKSESTKKLEDKGIIRKGFHFFTCFADVPEVWEDQILLDVSHADKIIWKKKRYQLFGEVLVKEGDIVEKEQKIGLAPDGKFDLYDMVADKSVVESITEANVNVGGTPCSVKIIVVKYGRYLKDGTKLTNLHGNKGVIRLKPLGVATNPVTGEKRKIDLIVSAKSIRKRKNYGQLLEAMLANVAGEQEIVLTDDTCPQLADIKSSLRTKSFREDGCWDCDTYAGKLTTCCGTVFWGVIKDVESALWDDRDTIQENSRGLRVAGIKLSSVEFRALETIFGADNPVNRELFTYIQGSEDLQDLLRVMESKTGAHEKEHALTVDQVKHVNQNNGTIISKEEIVGTVVDEDVYPSGFFIQLPFSYETVLGPEGKVVFEGMPIDMSSCHMATIKPSKIYRTTKLFIPSSNFRKCWRHSTGKYGLSEVGTLVNNMITMCHRHMLNQNDPDILRQAYRSVFNYINKVTAMMSTKRGEIATCGMSVRYPYSSKAVATLSCSLPKNTVAIHRSMAEKLEVVNGEVVLCERYPCLGFTSMRLVKVKITDDPLCKYTIRVSGNSLCSQGLDFDGDVIYLFALKTKEAKELLEREWANPNKSYYNVIKELNQQKGVPHVKAMTLDEYEIGSFGDLTCEEHKKRVGNLTGVKAYTGPVIAFLYNLMRVLENSDMRNDKKANVGLEVFFNKVGESVFDLKHGEESPHKVFVDAICCGNVHKLVESGFDHAIAAMVCKVVKIKAAEIGISDLEHYHEKVKQGGGSNIVNLIVRKQNRIYFASRANLETCSLLDCLSAPAVDIPSKMLKLVLSGKTKVGASPMERAMDKALIKKLNGERGLKAVENLFEIIDSKCGASKTEENECACAVVNDEVDDEAYEEICEAFSSFSLSRKA